ncbi:hypothetical protein HHK36_030257 [Tetracentron sinense]|uniref:Uncharacterized protein n=1 Tax=Tetracentron sinense TaxID=13715 RepID=A0A834YAW7_TETSI|nr:hypothetical protein HHK36_030257 [Tetracentron sinense]
MLVSPGSQDYYYEQSEVTNLSSTAPTSSFRNMSSSSARSSSRTWPTASYLCKARPCLVMISTTQKNLERAYYSCPGNRHGRKYFNFVKWYDEYVEVLGHGVRDEDEDEDED